VASTETLFRVDDISGQTLNSMQLYFDIGIPENSGLMTTPIQLEPKLVEISPNMGSAGGTKIVPNVPGVGQGVSGLDLVDADGNSICQSVTVEAYSQVTCLTIVGEIPALSDIQVSFGGSLYSCVNSDASKCQYGQVASDPFPIVTALTLMDPPVFIVFTGTGFFTSGHTASVSFGGISASTVTVSSDTSLTASWSLGVPIVETDETPSLSFTDDATGTVYFAQNSEVISNPLAVTAEVSVASCSFAGGCLLEITANSLSTTLAQDGGHIDVCG